MRTPEVDERDEKEIEQRIAVSAPVVHEAIRHEGERELKRPTSALAWSGFAAGLTMGFSFIGEGLSFDRFFRMSSGVLSLRNSVIRSGLCW